MRHVTAAPAATAAAPAPEQQQPSGDVFAMLLAMLAPAPVSDALPAAATSPPGPAGAGAVTEVSAAGQVAAGGVTLSGGPAAAGRPVATEPVPVTDAAAASAAQQHELEPQLSEPQPPALPGPPQAPNPGTRPPVSPMGQGAAAAARVAAAPRPAAAPAPGTKDAARSTTGTGPADGHVEGQSGAAKPPRRERTSDSATEAQPPAQPDGSMLQELARHQGAPSGSADTRQQPSRPAPDAPAPGTEAVALTASAVAARPVETAPAPVAAPPPAADAIAVQAMRLMEKGGGRTHVVLRVDPPEVGPVVISLDVRGDQVDVALHVQDPDAVASLDAQRDAVQEALANNGLSLQDFSVGADARRQQEPAGGGQRVTRTQSAPPNAQTDGAVAPAAEEGVWL